MTQSRFSLFVVALAGTGLLSTAASALPVLGDGQGLVRQPIEQVRIVCGPFGRCFRIDAYGRRIPVPRPVLRPRLDLSRPGFGGPEIGRPGFPGRGPDGRGPDGSDRAGPAGRPGPQGGDQIQHRPQGGGPQGGDQMQHRPQGGGGAEGGGQMQRRPQGGGAQGGGQMQRRPQGGSGPQGGGAQGGDSGQGSGQ
ncbi:MAG TPA: hypothetical protein VH414_07410 [Lichenihabitans sp.]|nr:hypothetical protein [Lichenihabitans sp.]